MKLKMQQLCTPFSRKTFIPLCVLVLSTGIPVIATCMAADWSLVGEKGFFAAFGAPSIIAANGNMPYIAYSDGSTGRPTVQTFDGTNWNIIGTISTQPASDISITKNNTGALYVLYGDYTRGYKGTVKKLPAHSSTWQRIGAAGFTEGAITSGSSAAIAIGTDNTPFIAYIDSSHANKATVMQYNAINNQWLTVGTPGFSTGVPDSISIAIDSTGTPYIAYSDMQNNGTPDKASVMKFNGTAWQQVGGHGISTGGAMDVTLTIDRNDVLYLGFRDMDRGEKATVMQYTNSTWHYVGKRGFSTSFAPYISLSLANNTVPYVVFSDHGNSWKATAMKFNGRAWENIGSPGFSNDTADQTKIVIGDHDVYALYQDYSANNRFTVMKYPIYTGSTDAGESTTGSSIAKHLAFLPILLHKKD